VAHGSRPLHTPPTVSGSAQTAHDSMSGLCDNPSPRDSPAQRSLRPRPPCSCEHLRQERDAQRQRADASEAARSAEAAAARAHAERLEEAARQSAADAERASAERAAAVAERDQATQYVTVHGMPESLVLLSQSNGVFTQLGDDGFFWRTTAHRCLATTMPCF